ncbi:MAG: SDR family oxidoreductase [Pseudomonadota bacterium]
MTTVLITGANRGFGLGLTRVYADRGDHQVLACCRSPEQADDLNALVAAGKPVELFKLDVADLRSIAELGAALGDRPIDVLINNAGIFGKNPPATTGFEEQQFGLSDWDPDWIMPFRTNVMGPMAMVETLVDNVAASEQKKIVVITSIVGSISHAMGHMFGYAASKAAANMTARNLALALQGRGIVVNPLHPGYAKTDMGGEAAHVEVDDAVAGIVARIDAMSLARTGAFLSFDGSELPW